MAVRGRSGAPSDKSPSASAGRDTSSSAWVWSDAAEARCSCMPICDALDNKQPSDCHQTPREKRF